MVAVMAVVIPAGGGVARSPAIPHGGGQCVAGLGGEGVLSPGYDGDGADAHQLDLGLVRFMTIFIPR